jgi:hypothetical protein
LWTVVVIVGNMFKRGQSRWGARRWCYIRVRSESESTSESVHRDREVLVLVSHDIWAVIMYHDHHATATPVRWGREGRSG